MWRDTLLPYLTTTHEQKIVAKKLSLESKFLNKSRVTALIVRLEITQMYAAIGDHLQETATRMKILRVFLKMLCELINLF